MARCQEYIDYSDATLAASGEDGAASRRMETSLRGDAGRLPPRGTDDGVGRPGTLSVPRERIGNSFPGAFPRSSEESEGAGGARHGEDFVGLGPRCCSEALLDDGVRSGEPDVSNLVKEMDGGPDKGQCQNYILQIAVTRRGP